MMNMDGHKLLQMMYKILTGVYINHNTKPSL